MLINVEYYGCKHVHSACSKIAVKFCSLYMPNIEKLEAPFDTPTLNLNLINVRIISKIRLYATFSLHCNCRQ